MAKAPREGVAKTRLVSALGALDAAWVARKMLEQPINTAKNSKRGVVELCMTPSPTHPAWSGLRRHHGLAWSGQGNGDLGKRMAEVAERVAGETPKQLLIGMDCPSIGEIHPEKASADLEQHDASLIPSLDGGYLLLCLRRFHPSLLAGIPWSTNEVCKIAQKRLIELGWSWQEQTALMDIDTPPADFVTWGRQLMGKGK